MAYVVGSASVEIVPDFRNAQNRITRFFESQPNQINVPVRPNMDQQSVREAEVQARTVGNKLGEAIAEGAQRGVNRGGASGAIMRQIVKLEAEIEKARTTSTDAARQLRIAETRLSEGRALGLEPASARMLSLERAVEVARQKVVEVDQRAVRASAELESARRRLEEASRAEIERTAKAQMDAIRKADEARERADQARYQRILKEEAAEQARSVVGQQRLQQRLEREQAARDRANEREVSAEIRTAQRVAAEEERIARQAEATAARERERVLRQEEQWARKQAQVFSRALNQAIREAEKEQIRIQIDEKHALEEGRKQGNIVTRAIQHEVRQNAGLIAAAVGAALAFGGPLALAGATVLFGGIATAAVVQNEKVRQSWVGLWNEIKSGAQSDANILVPTYQRMAGQIGRAFQDIRPMIRDTYEDLGTQLETVTASATDAAEKALPGLTRAIQNGMPVATGFGALIEDIGSGLSDFYDILGANSGTAGEVFRDLGSSMRELLPMLGQLLNTGMQVATAVLPAINTSLRGVNTALDLTGGILPDVLTGFLAFTAVRGIGNMVQNFGTKLGLASLQGGQFADAQRRGADVANRLARALPAVGVVAGAVGVVMSRSEEQAHAWAEALLEGGSAAVKARAQMGDFGTAMEVTNSGLAGFITGLVGVGTQVGITASTVEKGREEYEKYLDSLDPLTFAKTKLQQATNDLSFALSDESATGQDVADAQAEVARWSSRAASEQEKLERATLGVTEAMVAQGEAARSLADSQFKYENALNDLEDALTDYNAALAEGDEEDKSRALLALQEGYNDVASAARDVAFDAMPALLNESQKAILADKAQLDALNSLHDQYGDLGPILEGQRTRLANIISESDGAALAQAQLAAALGEVGIAVETIPGQKNVKVDALTDDARTQLEAIGIDVVELPDGSFSISADGEDAIDKINEINTAVENVDGKTATPTVDLDDKRFNDKQAATIAKMGLLGELRPTPIADLDNGLLNSKGRAARGDLDDLGSKRPTPIADLNKNPFNNGFSTAMGNVGELDRQNPTPTANMNNGPFSGVWRSSMANVAELARQRPTPTANMNGSSFNGVFGALMGRVFELGSQRPTPTANMNGSSFNGVFSTLMGRVSELARQRPTPTVSAIDNASGTINGVQGRLNGLRDKTITLTTVNRTVNQSVPGSSIRSTAAAGGAMEFGRFHPTYKFDGGGAVIGRGSSRDDLIPALGPDPFARYRIANGEHILDGRDVALMGGQAGVYAFREALNRGYFGSPNSSSGIRAMIAGGASTPAAAAPSSLRDVKIFTSDNPRAIIRAMRAEQQQHDALASVW